MLRTIFAVGAMALLGLFLMRFLFGVLAGLVGLVIGLALVALKIALVGLVIYFIIRIISPDTARRMRERWSGHGS